MEKIIWSNAVNEKEMQHKATDAKGVEKLSMGRGTGLKKTK